MKNQISSVILTILLVLTGCAQQQSEQYQQTEQSQTPNKPPFSANGERVDTVEQVAQTGQPYQVVAQEINYFENNDKIKGYLTQPDVIGNSPAVILVPDWWGVNDAIKERAKKLAEKGYTVLVMDFYNGESTNDPARAKQLAQQVQINLGDAHQNLFWAKRYLQQMIRVDRAQVKLVDWCFGDLDLPDAEGIAAWMQGQTCGKGETTVQ